MIGRRLITDNSLSVLYFASVFVLLAHRIHLMLKIKFCILVKILISMVKKKIVPLEYTYTRFILYKKTKFTVRCQTHSIYTFETIGIIFDF
jgi:hypothetical protein